LLDDDNFPAAFHFLVIFSGIILLFSGFNRCSHFGRFVHPLAKMSLYGNVSNKWTLFVKNMKEFTGKTKMKMINLVSALFLLLCMGF